MDWLGVENDATPRGGILYALLMFQRSYGPNIPKADQVSQTPTHPHPPTTPLGIRGLVPIIAVQNPIVADLDKGHGLMTLSSEKLALDLHILYYTYVRIYVYTVCSLQ